MTSPIRERADQLDAELDRWLGEVARAGVRSTLGYGIVFRAAEALEDVLRTAVEILRSAAPSVAWESISRADGHKPLERATFGELVKVIERVAKATRLSDGGPFAPQAELTLLNRLSRIRNDFVHGRFRPDFGRPNLTVEALLKGARDLCRSALIHNLDQLDGGRETLVVRHPRRAAEVVPTEIFTGHLPVKVGGRYTYTEEDQKFEVQLLADLSTREFTTYEIHISKVLRGDPDYEGETCTVTMRRGVRFAGMWELHPLES